MEDKKNETPCEQEHKKVSKRYLAFYIIGLFSVALVLILLSYVTQLRADRQLANMNSELAQKDTTVQGVQEKVVTLQQTVEEQKTALDKAQSELDAIRTELGIGEDDAAGKRGGRAGYPDHSDVHGVSGKHLWFGPAGWYGR